MAFFIGFFTILVCWINHYHCFLHIVKCTPFLCIVNALVLFVVGFVSYPTDVLAEYITQPESIIAVQFYDFTYILMASSYRILWGYATKFNLLDPNTDQRFIKAVKQMYNLGIVHTILTFIISFWCIPLALIIYVLLFSIFMIPSIYIRFILKHSKQRTPKPM